MDFSWWLVQAAVFAASLLQAATGIGFGIIAGPILLLMLNSAAAIQVSIMLSLIIAIQLAPSIVKRIDKPLFKLLVYGTCVGIPVGILIFLKIDIVTLKALAGVAVVFMALSSMGLFEFSGGRASKGYSSRAGVGMGLISGVMSSSLGMPGPVPATWMIARSFDKEVIRATILMLFIPSYCAALAFQAVMPGVNGDTIWWALGLAPATIGGVFFGKVLEPRIDAATFKRIITVVLVCTAASLFTDVAIKTQLF